MINNGIFFLYTLIPLFLICLLLKYIFSRITISRKIKNIEKKGKEILQIYTKYKNEEAEVGIYLHNLVIINDDLSRMLEKENPKKTLGLSLHTFTSYKCHEIMLEIIQMKYDFYITKFIQENLRKSLNEILKSNSGILLPNSGCLTEIYDHFTNYNLVGSAFEQIFYVNYEIFSGIERMYRNDRSNTDLNNSGLFILSKIQNMLETKIVFKINSSKSHLYKEKVEKSRKLASVIENYFIDYINLVDNAISFYEKL
ncbi:hypothetical protein EDEG_03065 [Edhazardia aedis USNM 41457]|uniref:Uncharacterized protein n=1 Tax=Edhazardia aedis (strain USNM 41457) TaxID=1003232 RepID=J9D3Y8_EDHAE|nr:hypothetical protein EDEG_03065 [Edhazardia aedis USNM 41457]|eukprot:EJW02526.1 hypothetical protein EDEG_03065 [Edhazardia aedis USNM 41457]